MYCRESRVHNEPPGYQKEAFNCPHCNAFAHHYWVDLLHKNTHSRGTGIQHLGSVNNHNSAAFCARCGQFSVWINKKMLYPGYSVAPLPSEDMPDDVKVDFFEARDVVNSSPRAAAALLRLALQKLMPHLGEKGKDLNTEIASLVKKGLPQQIQQSLDCIRVIGNNAVHPGQIDLKDDLKTAIALFDLLNMIVQVMITQPKKISDLYKKLPESSVKQIQKRDATG
ncbi:DUF4145 domain-containing protein [Methanoculleus sp. UBA413]|jgi:hypothetical protein|uniref:DUF4145 domain-containing protein n=1 Tax=Methanoculleus sp. UBA413 TaxID=1915509 RepID=UPI00257CADEE|nr:DUF4145 domain-containing protein [Methanoculleus sp. UBA413]